MSDKLTPVFVIMPFSKTTEEHTERYWKDHFENFLTPIIKENKEFKAFRSEPLRGDILREIIKELVACPIVLADLTDTNPNVFLELGIRQSFKQCTITIAEKGTKIPFDISMKSIIYYHPKDHLKYEKFKKQLQKALKDCKDNPKRPDSIVLETISGRGSLYQIIHRDEAIRRLKALLTELVFNEALCDVIYELIEKNKNEKQEIFNYPTNRFRNNAIELLLTSRYLDEKEDFYKTGYTLLHNYDTKNSQLNDWADHRKRVEKWFLRKSVKEEFIELLVQFKEEVKKIKKRLETTC